MRHGNQNYNNDSANCYESFTSENSSTSNEGGYIEAAQDRFHGRDREYESLQSSEVKFKNYGIKSAKEPKKVNFSHDWPTSNVVLTKGLKFVCFDFRSMGKL